jgi:hypothetical protein
MEVKTLTEDELNSLRSYDEKQTQYSNALGSVEYQMALLKASKAKIEEYILKLEEENQKLSETLTQKYGFGRIDLETGEITIG